jgi:hypothetical protein
MPTRIEVDFNSRDEAGLIPAYVADITGPYGVGSTVEAYDVEGNRCTGRIASITGEHLAIEPFWQTFTDQSVVQVFVTSGGAFTATRSNGGEDPAGGTRGLTISISNPLAVAGLQAAHAEATRTFSQTAGDEATRTFPQIPDFVTAQ